MDVITNRVFRYVTGGQGLDRVVHVNEPLGSFFIATDYPVLWSVIDTGIWQYRQGVPHGGPGTAYPLP
jgi:hypothetical protein